MNIIQHYLHYEGFELSFESDGQDYDLDLTRFETQQLFESAGICKENREGLFVIEGERFEWDDLVTWMVLSDEDLKLLASTWLAQQTCKRIMQLA